MMRFKRNDKNSTKETKNDFGRLNKSAKKAVARAMKEEAVRKINELGRNPNNAFRPVRKMKIDIIQMLLEKGTCEEMMEQFTTMIRIEQNCGKNKC